MKKTNKLLYFFIIIGFLLTLYWVEASPWGSYAAAQCNGGYGTFDMKNYNVDSVTQILEGMTAEGYDIYYHYYMGDYLFIIFFGLLQAIILKGIYGKLKTGVIFGKQMYLFAMGITVLRGVVDFMENTLLVITLRQYPQVHERMITTASMCTQIKLWCIRLWVLSVLLGIIMRMVLGIRKKLSVREEKGIYGEGQR